MSRECREKLSLNGIWKCVPDEDNRLEGNIRNKPVYHSEELTWEDIHVPAHWQKAGYEDFQGVMWYKTVFRAPSLKKNKMFYICFDAVDYNSEVWLNGVYLGAHEGDFDAFEFNVSDFLEYCGENTLVIKVTSELDTKPERKKIAKGGLYHWDCLPVKQEGLTDCPEVPSSVNAHYPNPLVNPGGIWKGVYLEERCKVHIEHIQVTPYLKDEYKKATIYLDVEIQNNNSKEAKIDVEVSFLPHNFRGKIYRWKSQSYFQRPGTSSYSMTDQLSNPKLWWTWELGFPHLYKAVIEVWVNGVLVDKKIQIFGIREIKMDEKWIFYLNGTRVFIKGNNYLSDQFLSLMTKESYQLDVQMMLDANMNTTRLFAHAEQEEFYQLCNEKGIMVFQDLPFQWGYESTGLFIKRAEDVSRRFVRMLYNHPSIILWSCHSESRFHDYNKLDNMLLRVVKELDSLRPVIKNSVLVSDEELPHFFETLDDFTDYIGTHLSVHWVGWYWGKIEDAEFYNPMFVTEYGTQSIPNEDSLKKFMNQESLWPVNWEIYRTWGFQTNIYQTMLGSVMTQSLQELIDITQEYQVQFYKEHTEALRRKKYNHVGGLLQFHFVNTGPSIDWSIIDYYRQPKKAYFAMAKAFEPLHLSFNGEVTDGELGKTATVTPWIVNDYNVTFENCEIAYKVFLEDGTLVDQQCLPVPKIVKDSVQSFESLTLPVSSGTTVKVTGQLKDSNGMTVMENDKIIRSLPAEDEVQNPFKSPIRL
ncbi:beta galactosidase jelly roll domain-containing protein [Fictibacillus sp. WQ 8-8]|uniref:glycoside hydrolase family 2 protein n=1 Tax=Fictibacillus sp. WQ 8-8 TaxID=2938788 RepID=UPI0021094C9F|nr:glycoside hydrolase family 2 TIM barrel-domain containing protein [Fictibacillus sp. WQ 8-8]MCQ6266931.1 beta galactosidase jelly roll domain-containing protein [Fictibacillus sp. WQ 8-8]